MYFLISLPFFISRKEIFNVKNIQIIWALWQKYFIFKTNTIWDWNYLVYVIAPLEKIKGHKIGTNLRQI